MTLSVWRIVHPRWSSRAFDGEGARRYGGRWNSVGTPLVYLSESKALAVLEILVHLQSAMAPPRFDVFRVLPDRHQLTPLPVEELPAEWNAPRIQPTTQEIGDQWARSRSSLFLRVPSALVPEEFNYLMNPLHPEATALRIENAQPFALDPRLLAESP